MVEKSGSDSQENKPATGKRVGADTLAKVGEVLLQISVVGKNIRMYPSGHPQLKSTLEKTKITLDTYFAENDAITIGVSADSLMFSGTNLPSKNPAFGDLAEDLHAFSIYSLTLKPGIAIEEIQRFSEIISNDQEDSSFENLNQLIENADLPHIEAVFLNWNTAEFEDIEEILLEKSSESESSWSDYLQELMRSEAAGEGEPEESQEYLDALKVFKALVENVRPDLRTALLAKPLKLKDRKPLMDEEMFTQPPARDVLSVINDVNSGEDHLHPYILRLLNVLSAVCSDQEGQEVLPTKNKSNNESVVAVSDIKVLLSDNLPQPVLRMTQLRSKIDELLKKFPRPEQKATLPDTDTLARENRKHMMLLLLDFLGRETFIDKVQNHCAVLLKTLKSIEPEDNLNELNYALNEVLRQIKRLHVSPASDREPGENDSEAELKTIKKKTIIQHLLLPLDLPGIFTTLYSDRDKPAVKTFIKLLELSTEFTSDAIIESYLRSQDKNEQKALIKLIKLNKKHYVLDIKRRLRRAVPDEITELLKIVPDLGDEGLNKEINRLLNNDNLSIKLAALKTLVTMDAPNSSQILVEHLESPDRDISMGTIDIAMADDSTDVLAALLNIVIGNDGPFWRKIDLERKIKAVRAMSAVGNPEVLDVLLEFVKIRHFFRAKAFETLKTEIFRSLKGYPAKKTKAFLIYGADSKNDNIVKICQRMAKK